MSSLGQGAAFLCVLVQCLASWRASLPSPCDPNTNHYNKVTYACTVEHWLGIFGVLQNKFIRNETNNRKHRSRYSLAREEVSGDEALYAGSVMMGRWAGHEPWAQSKRMTLEWSWETGHFTLSFSPRPAPFLQQCGGQSSSRGTWCPGLWQCTLQEQQPEVHCSRGRWTIFFTMENQCLNDCSAHASASKKMTTLASLPHSQQWTSSCTICYHCSEYRMGLLQLCCSLPFVSRSGFNNTSQSDGDKFHLWPVIAFVLCVVTPAYLCADIYWVVC